MMDKKTFDLYVLQFEELEKLLNTEWLDMKKLLESNHIDLTTTHFISYMEGEDGIQYGVLFSKNKEVITFQIDENDNIELKLVKDSNELERLKINDPSIEAALTYFN
ncbi:hypothetical protein [Gilliamella sp. wkB112]|uniref:hypothetical protein n=1 Tax=Gilliamella sp. wkB112 TaxID=3120257 RepID=UPI00080DAE6D|nr:hypothetical protein [Gilliamella apicola]OCG00878.1 hypothetical protein A9G12_03710 [Gilliamella apicola]